MTKARAFTFFLLSIALLIGSCAPFGYVIYHEATATPDKEVPIADPITPEIFTFRSTPGTLARFSVKTRIETSSVQEKNMDFKTEFEPRYRFPLRYTITDSTGGIISQENTYLAWDEGSRSISNEAITSTGGSLDITTGLEKTTVPADGTMNIEIAFSQDTTYRAKLVDPRLQFYENVINNTWYIVSGIIMLIVGGILCVISFIFVLITVGNTERPVNTGESEEVDTAVTRQDSYQRAMLIQLSSLSGCVIPFGHIIVPVTLWLCWRSGDDFVNKAGSEAVNFNLTVTFYYLFCVLLFIVVIGMFLFFAVMIFHLVLIIVATVHSSNGELYRYPLTIRFIKA